MQAEAQSTCKVQALGRVAGAHVRDVIWVLSSTAATALQPSKRSKLAARLHGSEKPKVRSVIGC